MVWKMLEVFHVETSGPTPKLLQLSNKNTYRQGSLHPISLEKQLNFSCPSFINYVNQVRVSITESFLPTHKNQSILECAKTF